MKVKDIFLHLVEEAIAPPLSQAGFDRNDLSFHRKIGAFLHVVELQASAYNEPHRFLFYINVGTNPDELSRVPISESLAVYECWVNTRIASLVSSAPSHFEITHATQKEQLLEELRSHMFDLVSTLDEIDSIESMINNALHDSYPQAALTYYAAGDDDRALNTVKEMLRKHPDMGYTLSELIQRYGFDRLADKIE